jgi:hypothetical protein
LHHKHVESHPGETAEAFGLVEYFFGVIKLPVCNYPAKLSMSHQLVSGAGKYETGAAAVLTGHLQTDGWHESAPLAMIAALN